MSTTLVKPAEVERKWYLLDAAGKSLIDFLRKECNATFGGYGFILRSRFPFGVLQAVFSI